MFALINRNLTDTGKRKAQVEIILPADLHPTKPYWVPVVVEEIDTSTGPDTVTSPWVETVEVGRVLRARATRDKTQAELSAEDQARVGDLMSISGIDRALAKALFAVVNDVRTLKGQNTISAAQFKTYLKDLIR